MSEYNIWVVVEKYNSTKRNDDYRYAGAPCTGYEEALDLVNNHVTFGYNLSLGKLVEDGVYYDEINPATGEVVKEYIIKRIGRM